MFTESNAFLARLSAEQRTALQGRDCVLKHGVRLHEPGSVVDFAYFPRTCVVLKTFVMDDGRSAGPTIVGREGVVGASTDFALHAGPSINNTRADVLIDGAALRVPISRMAALMQAQGDFAANVAGYRRSLMRQAIQNSACTTLHSLEQRVSCFLLLVDQRSGGQRLPITQEALSQTVGAHRASLNKTLQVLELAGALVQLRRGTIEIADRASLAALSCQCHAAA